MVGCNKFAPSGRLKCVSRPIQFSESICLLTPQIHNLIHNFKGIICTMLGELYLY